MLNGCLFDRFAEQSAIENRPFGGFYDENNRLLKDKNPTLLRWLPENTVLSVFLENIETLSVGSHRLKLRKS